ncbi:exosortase K [Thermodesulfobacteriota bacterium]
MRFVKPSKSNTDLLKSSILYIAVFIAAMGLKYQYSRAGSDELGWILGPTTWVVEHFSGIPFEQEAGTGYVSRDYRIIIAPACAGVNFFIIAFCMSAFAGLSLLEHSKHKSLWVVSSAAVAYLLTVVVNALRIFVSIWTLGADVYSKTMTPEMIHRIEGTFIYFFFLSLFYLLLRKTLRCVTPLEGRVRKCLPGINVKNSQKGGSCLVPMFWYTLFCLGIPLVNRGYQKNGTLFVHHCLVVLSVCTVVILLIFLVQLFYRRIADKIVS